MKQDYRVKQSGITLLEALISLVVISVGVLAIAKLYGEIMASTGESKARAEAIQIAESRVDSLRNALSQDDLVRAIDALDTPEGSPVQGVNANFHVRSDVDPTDDASGQIAQLDVAVRVVWEGMRENEEELGVLVSSDVLWSPPDHAVNLARGTLPSTVSIPDPSGEGRNFGEAIDPSEADSIAPIDDMDRNLERRTLEDLQQIVDRDTGEVLLETDNQEGFSMVSGFLVGVGEGASDDDGGGGGNQGGGGGGGNQGGGGGGGNQGGGGGGGGNQGGGGGGGGNAPSGNEKFRIDASAGGLCLNTQATDSAGNTLEDVIFYQCEVGVGWYGNIGVIDLEGDVGSVAGKICMGDPSVSNDHLHAPIAGVRRDYRGIGIGGGEVLGQGIPGIPLPEGADGGEFGHHFVVRRYGANNAGCREVLEEAGHEVAGDYDAFVGNLGKHWTLDP